MFLIVWSESGMGIRGTRVTLDGSILDPVPFTIADEGDSPVAASDGSAFLLAWHRRTPSPLSWPPYLDLIDGEILAQDVRVVVPFSIGGGVSVKTTWTGTHYAIAWQVLFIRGSAHAVRFVTPSGFLSGGIQFRSPSDFYYAPVSSVAGSGTEQVVVTEGNGVPDEYSLIYGTNRFVVGNDGSVSPGKPLPSPYWFIAYDGREYVVGPAPVTSLGPPFVAIADRNAVHIVEAGVSTSRRRAVH